MSTAHRPTWDPAVGRADTKAYSKQYSARDAPAQTKLKFRKPGQGGIGDQDKRRDLRLELNKAEEEANEKKRKAQGLSLEDIGQGTDDSQQKIPKLIDNPGEGDAHAEPSTRTHESQASEDKPQTLDKDEEADDDESDDDSEDDEAELLRELDKIKRERAEEKARKDEEQNSAKAASREEEVASGNPLLNLQNALGASPSSTQDTGFTVKRRWDDDLIFKNQALNTSDKPKKEFVNDLLRTDFHRKFMYRFIK
ncbi:hypothetical protein E3P92_00438 [Wallemia ichthyophaga]|uniref:Cwf15/Cwc15 cell cycle control protein n=2 Tax=Wallemia ichthyophaga TaxID=245174 RepID=A0A4T0HQY6_WALIC|nr:Pre-mRNA-splicing factor cwc15 [Wallemia ichthyophaga EXF-994]TIA73228.1 hypothetical protein E3P91_01534 [Wallemia ichthyophaga]EOR01439.1 Pre-mRNA-splicing factor cwc15 [Wallemia ichthyophaga EXF-994]TIA82183.1 hypothetical protein E3P98_01543 [Wallemia ichthyophaga]TIA94268.1 hypothetical protein E3P97_00179 [Wallemia ichthyophaga]TIB04180.1 hypothetical protein E3P94_00644 [Wallemia ichthyophaga]